MTPLIFAAADKHTVLPVTVYLRQFWSDAWTEAEYLHAVAVDFPVAPSVPTAQLVYQYGRGIRPDKSTWEIIERLTERRRWFVKISLDVHQIDEETGNLNWYGVLEVDTDRLGGVRTDPDGGDTYESGMQTFTCYGLQRLLQEHRIISHHWRNSTTHASNEAEVAPDFNADGWGNRSETGGWNSYDFTDKIREPDTKWSTREIVRYLLDYQTPKVSTGLAGIPFDLEDPDDLLPDWDAPVIRQQNRTTAEVLSDLFVPSKLLGYWLDVEESTDPLATDTVLFRPFSFLGADLPTPDGTLKANPRQFTINFESDPDCMATITTSSIQQLDQVIYRGARRRSVCSLGVEDNNIEPGWLSALELEYNAGASTDASYPTWTEVDDRQRADAEARSADRLAHVYTRFAIPADWDGKAYSGYTGVPISPVFPVEGDTWTTYPINPRELRILNSLPLLDGHDYESFETPDDITTETTAPWSELHPVVFAPLPEDPAAGVADKRWVQLDRNAAAAGIEETDDAQSRTWSATVRVLDRDRALHLRVAGAPQHAIAHGTFSGQSHESILKWGEYDFEEFVFLVGLEDQRYCEARYPADDDLPAGLPFVRRHQVDAGDGYRLDYLAPGTMIGIEPDTGAPIITDGGYIRDDRPELETMCLIAFAYLGIERRALTFGTQRVNNAMRPGDYITDIGDKHTHTINAVITNLSVRIDHAEGPKAGPTSIQYSTAFMDATNLL